MSRIVTGSPLIFGRAAPSKARFHQRRFSQTASSQSLQELWAFGCSLTDIAEESYRRAENACRNEWIFRLPREEVMKNASLLQHRASARSEVARRTEFPLLGTTFAVKDNLEVKGLPTTNALDYRSPRQAPIAQESAAVVQRLEELGALLIGKTNMDCAATGLVGVRSPYGICQNAFGQTFISGGSSSGSGVVVATGQVSFSLGTDTAGSGRVPAALNNIVGLKASRGLISTHGLVRACRSLDCVSIFALTTREAQVVLNAAASVGNGRGPDPWDRSAAVLNQGPRLPGKFTFGIPSKPYLDFSSFGNAAQERSMLYAEAWQKSVDSLQAIGGKCVEVDYAPFNQAAELLYQGPWVAERLSGLAQILDAQPEIVDATVRSIVEQGKKYTAQQCFEAMYRLQELKRAADVALENAGVDVLVTPTVGATYKIQDVLNDPTTLNSNLGRFTNHMNLLDLCGIAVPVTFAADNLPFGITVSAKAGHESIICDIAHQVHSASGLKAGALSSSAKAVMSAVEASYGSSSLPFLPSVETFQVAVCGAHMEGLALNWQLTERGGRFVKQARTAPRYRLVAFDGMKPPRPGLIDASDGAAIDLEIWELPSSSFGSFMKLVAQPLGIGWIELEDGERVQGFRQVDVHADRNGQLSAGKNEHPVDITHHGSWRNFLKCNQS